MKEVVKKVLIVGDTSYIARGFAQYIQARPQYNITTKSISARGNWAGIDFSAYDCVLFTAGIAHRKQTARNRQLYYTLNRDLAVAVATLAKASGVAQFIYLSSMAVYGVKQGAIYTDTQPNPDPSDHYATSKHQAESALLDLASPDFAVSVLRPPLVYGKDCPGKYNGLRKIAKHAPVLPTYANRRSMIHVDALAEGIAQCVLAPESMIITPQDTHFHCTSQLLFQLATDMGRKPLRLPWLNVFIKLALPFVPPIKTAFGDLYYAHDHADS